MSITSSSPSVLVDVDDAICRITMNRPNFLNALDLDLMNALVQVTRDISSDKTIRCVILEGSGEHFMAGGDIKHFGARLEELPTQTDFSQEIEAMITGFHEAIINMRTMPKPIIAGVRGAVAGAGVSLMLACDLVVAAESSFYTLAYCHLGASPDGGSTFALPRAVGMKHAMEIALLGDRFDSVKAERWGLVNVVVPDLELEKETNALARRLASGPTHAYARTKALMNESSSHNLQEQLATEARAFAECAATNDFYEGVSAFNAKRSPAFTGS